MTSTQPQPPRVQPLQLVDLFAGPGGLDVAARWLGLGVHGIEWDGNACATRTQAGLGTLHDDVREHGPKRYPDASVLTGGPPCQTFTVAGGGAGRRALDTVLGFVKDMAAGIDVTESVKVLEDERTGLVLEPLRWALEAASDDKPYQAIVLEQVPAVLPVWKAMEEVLAGIGYKTVSGILHTEDFGVPQTRRRAVLIAHRDHQPQLPKPTHRRYRKGVARSDGDQSLLPWVTMGSALSRSGSFEVVSNYGTGGDPKARGRRSSDEPSATVTGKISRNRLYAPGDESHELPRFETSEAGLLQTFPRDYPWSGKDVSQQIGNAIPPRLAAHVLAAALGWELQENSLDTAVRGSWASTEEGTPLLLVRPIGSESDVAFRAPTPAPDADGPEN
ncbi:DNA cytosine methyltransferase [Streptacidiphilus albus]|uniref:DNA cytosine methyltransferase n=1 Tax=Streptacidiphilus albus TaxID=105425 RepID=UPI0005A680FF|nr:DNA cytosine methyltransferase [Streptacidiphilus albus]